MLGSILSQELPGQIQAQTASRNLPPQVLAGLSQLGGNAQALFDPTRLASLPAAVVDAIRAALANTLHDLFIYAVIALALSAVVSVFLDDIPIGARRERAERGPVVALAD